MPRASWRPEESCGIAQAVSVIGDGWAMLIVRDVARGVRRFDELATELGISRKVLTQRLAHLIDHGILARRPYHDHPVRYDYELTAQGRALVPVLVAMQDWGDRWLLGDGALTGTARRGSPTVARMKALVGTTIPSLALPATDRERRDLVDPEARCTVLFGFPATGSPTPLPEGWAGIPGAVGCTLENRLFRAAYPSFAAAGCAVRGLSTQRADEQRQFAEAERLPFPLLSDTALRAVAALRLPTFRAAEVERIKRVVVVVDHDRTVRAVRYPVTDLDGTVAWALATASRVSARAG